MSLKFLPALFTVSFSMFISGVAFARRPPELARQQDAASRALAACPQDSASSYRGMRTVAAAAERPAMPRHRAVRRRMADHSMIACAGESLHTGGGYRDIFVRFEPESAAPLMACLQHR